MAVVAVIVLIAVLFLGATVMTLAVSSSLHTVDIVTAQDAVHYAAESAVARGVGAIELTGSCPTDPPVGINGQNLKIRCHSQLVGGDLGDEGEGSGRTSIQGGQLNPGACVPISLPAKMTAWTVIGWRGSGSVQVWTTAPGQGCPSSSALQCAHMPIPTNVAYFWCDAQDADRILYIVATGPVDVGTSVIRWAPNGPRVLWTIVGRAGFEVDEADIVLPKRQVLWNTVMP
jgi:hypothetical protein